jgi:hypothetical protein
MANVLLLLLLTAVLPEATTSNDVDVEGQSKDNSDAVEFFIQKTSYFVDRISLGINKWLSFSKWQCHCPPLEDTAKLRPYRAALYRTKSEMRVDAGDVGGLLRVIVIQESKQPSNERNNEVWIYYVHSNTWRKPLVNSPRVNFDGQGLLVTICGYTVVWIDDRVRSGVWIFDGMKESWSRVRVAQMNTSLSSISASESAVLSLSVSISGVTCHCNDVIIAFDLKGTLDTARTMRRQDCFRGYFEIVDFAIEPDPITDVGYPVDIANGTAVSATTEGLAFVIAPSTGLWQFDGKRKCWRFLANISIIKENSGLDVRYLDAAYFRKRRAYALFSDLTKDVFVFDLKSAGWFTPQMCRDMNRVFIGATTVLVDQDYDSVLVYNAVKGSCSQDLAELQLVGDDWRVTEISTPKLSLPAQNLGVALMSKGSVYHLSSYPVGGSSIEGYTERSKFSIELWRLDLTTMQWTYLFSLFWQLGDDKGACVHDDVLLFFHFTKFTRLRFVVGYIISENRLLEYEDSNTSVSVPQYREKYSLVALNSTSLFLCGGIRGREILKDSWILSLYSPESRTLEWKNVTLDSPVLPNIRSPLPRYGHSAAVVEDIIVLFGGFSHWNGSCDRDVWHLSLGTRTWTLGWPVAGRSGRTYPNDCILHVTALKQQVIAVTTRMNSNQAYTYSIWNYVPSARLWMFISSVTSSEYYANVAPFFWMGRLLLLDTSNLQLLYSYFACPPGFTAWNVSESDCRPCKMGYYSTGAGEKHCLPCPKGLTTTSTSATHIVNCSRCVDKFCKFGQCLVLQGQESPLPVCRCAAGFTGAHCNYPTYYLIALGLVLFAVVSTSAVFITLRMRKKRRRRERYLRNHVEQLNSVWQIKENEVRLLHRIGVGGYGEVYRAKYRDMTVAVKVMHLPTDETLVKEFEREVVYMQTIRHPNIVMFIGAGKMTEDERPFIVIEFLRLGSVRSLLDNRALTHGQRLGFARDVAIGMNFLHSLNPPRIHRDLKSDNLLVSKSWTVKIGDFGMGKLLPGDKEVAPKHRNFTRVRRSSDPSTLSLLEPDTQLSCHAVGAARWRAPEVSSHHAALGDVKVDVYR